MCTVTVIRGPQLGSAKCTGARSTDLGYAVAARMSREGAAMRAFVLLRGR